MANIPMGVKPINRRELLSYLWLGTVILWLLSLGGAAVWYALPEDINPPPPIDIGSLADFPPSSMPYQLLLAEKVPAWVVHTENTLYIFNRYAPYNSPYALRNSCLYAWNSETVRFEDPCSGDKWTLTGDMILEASSAKWSRTRLDVFSYEIVNGRILVSPTP